MTTETKATKIMLSMVGNRDPYAESEETDAPSEGSILTLSRHIQPDIIFIFPTAEQLGEKKSGTQANGEKTKEALLAMQPGTKVFLYSVHLPDPTDYQLLLSEMEKMVATVRQQTQKELGSRVEYNINISSGTSQMQACWLLLVNAGRLKAQVWQVMAPKWQEKGKSRCKKIETEFVEEQNKINRATSFFESCFFKSAQDELILLASATYNPHRAVIAEEMAKICEAYHHWDLFQHQKAHQLLTEAIKNLSRFPELSQLHNKLIAQNTTLKTIISDKEQESETNLLDLFHNAQRRRYAQQYVDCLARFKRLYEGCQNFFIRKELLIEPTQKYKNQPQWVKNIVSKHPESNFGLSDWDKIMAAKKKQFPIAEYLANEIRNFNQKRDKSIIAHGMGSVHEEDARVALQLAEKFIIEFFPRLEPNEYSFGVTELRKIASLIFKVI